VPLRTVGPRLERPCDSYEVNAVVLRIFVRISGLPPRNPTREQALRWIRRSCVRFALILAIPYASSIALGPPPRLWTILIVGMLASLRGFAHVNVELWRCRRQQRDGHDSGGPHVD
jgi:hypothetical protein